MQKQKNDLCLCSSLKLVDVGHQNKRYGKHKKKLTSYHKRGSLSISSHDLLGYKVFLFRISWNITTKYDYEMRDVTRCQPILTGTC